MEAIHQYVMEIYSMKEKRYLFLRASIYRETIERISREDHLQCEAITSGPCLSRLRGPQPHLRLIDCAILVANSVLRLTILIPLWPCAHGGFDVGSFVNGLSRAEARQPCGLENHSAGVAWCRRLRELCGHQTTMQ